MEETKENPLDSQKKESNFSELPVLDDRHEDLQEQIVSDEEELPPPEADKNEASELNVGTIFGFIFLLIVIVIMIIMVAGSAGKKKKAQQKELDKAGSKYEVEFKENAPEQIEEVFEDNKQDKQVEEENVDDVLDSLPDNLKPTPQAPAPAPVTPVGSSNYKSDRPDTRNSKSPRKIDGLIGQSAPVDTNQNIVKAMMGGGSYPSASASGNGGMTKEEYVKQMMERTKQIQDQMYGGSTGGFGGAYGNNTNQAAAYQQNKEQFYANGNGAVGDGQFMSYTSLWDGTVISGALVTAINTDNPGVVIARVTENVYSSYDHSFLLIPEGSLLYATYNSSVSYGQNKVQVAWNLLIRPDGYRITLGNMNGVNAQGASGYKGHVSNHPWQTLKALGMVAIYSMIQTEVTNDIKQTNNQYVQNAMSDMYRETAKIGNKIIDRALDIKPTITIKAGTEIKLITNTPLELPPVQINPVTRKYIRTR